MTAVMRRLASLFVALVAIVAPNLAAADLQQLSSAAYEYRNNLYSVPPSSGDYEQLRAQLDDLMAGTDQAAAETLAEGMVPAGYENYDLWRSLFEIKTKLGKGLDAAYVAYLATEYAPD